MRHAAARLGLVLGPKMNHTIAPAKLGDMGANQPADRMPVDERCRCVLRESRY